MSIRVAGALSGALAALALPPFDLWPLAFGALVPLALALSRPCLEYREVVAGGLWFGAIFYGVLLHWVPFTVHGLMPFGALFGSLSITILAATGGVQAIVLHYLIGRRARTPILAVPAVWVTTEVLLAYAGPFAFPWTPLGLSLAAVPVLAGPAEWIGVRGLSLWIALVNGGVVASLLCPMRRWAGLGAIATLIVALGPAVVGVVRDQSLPMSRLPPVLVAQIDVPRNALIEPALRDQRLAEALVRIVAPFSQDSAETIADVGAARPVIAILPEAPFYESWNTGVENQMRGIARELGLPILVGAHVFEDNIPGRSASEAAHNAIMLVEPDGATRLVHGKTRLVPGVERPGLLPGPRRDILQIGGLGLGVAVCFESAFGRDVRRLRKDGAELLVNPTNDGWFRPSLPGVESAAHAQHRAHLILRVVETRMGAVRSSLGGELLGIDPDGRFSVIRPVGEEGMSTVLPLVSPITTGYVLYGDAGGFAGLLFLVILLFPRRKRKGMERPSISSHVGGAFR